MAVHEDGAYVSVDGATKKTVDGASPSDRYVSHSEPGFSFFFLPRAGLVHITKGSPGHPLPADLIKLQYAAAIVELEEAGCGSLHSFVSTLFVKVGIAHQKVLP